MTECGNTPTQLMQSKLTTARPAMILSGVSVTARSTQTGQLRLGNMNWLNAAGKCLHPASTP
jgi:hypothetical protein